MFVRHFSRVKVRCMKVNLKSSLKENPDHLVIMLVQMICNLTGHEANRKINSRCCAQFKKGQA